MQSVLREVVDDDLPIFFEQQNDPEAIQMASFPAREWEPFRDHWNRIRRDDSVITKTILDEGAVAGNIIGFDRDGKRFVGYWLGRAHWGKGLATRALAELVAELERPLYAEVATTNVGSMRVLEKCGFEVVGTATEHHPDFGEIELLVMELVG